MCSEHRVIGVFFIVAAFLFIIAMLVSCGSASQCTYCYKALETTQ